MAAGALENLRINGALCGPLDAAHAPEWIARVIAEIVGAAAIGHRSLTVCVGIAVLYEISSDEKYT